MKDCKEIYQQLLNRLDILEERISNLENHNKLTEEDLDNYYEESLDFNDCDDYGVYW